MTSLEQLVARIASRDTPRTEAMVQADLRQMLLTAPSLNLSEVQLESPVGDRRRIDIEAGATVIEVKKDLRVGHVRVEAIAQLAGYVAMRESTTGGRYVGILTDGAEWRCFHLTNDSLREVASVQVSSERPDFDALLVWLEGVLATARDIQPTPHQIALRLGAGSPSHALDRESLSALFHASKDAPAVRTKRKLWARLLVTALGTQFEDSDDLFVEHTLLVNIADIIAHAVHGMSPETLPPHSILTGESFHQAGVFGVVEADFFDWVTEIPGGEAFIRTLARRLARFDWNAVHHDVLKVLYESVITTAVRKSLGEYYTPDWLAFQVVQTSVADPLATRVLDPSCGSGTFVFHAVRRYIAAATAAGQRPGDILSGVTRHVMGMDLHPVAVSLARVTYLLAIGPKLLKQHRGRIRVPVFLGDAVQWRDKTADLWSASELTIGVDDGVELVNSMFRFPRALLQDGQRFDDLVADLADQAAATQPSFAAVVHKHSITKEHRPLLEASFKTLCGLHKAGRDHIWGYYIRNLARPAWLSRPENRVDLLVGNPPWLAFRFMPGAMQGDFKTLAEERGLWHGAKVATHQDLSTLFVARALELYLKPGGRFGFVMPAAVLDRQQYAGFRKGRFTTSSTDLHAAFLPPWDLRKMRPHFFPVACAVVMGHRADDAAAMPPAGEVWSGRIPDGNVTWADVAPFIIREQGKADSAAKKAISEYHGRFRQGATIVPRVMFLVEEQDAGPLGLPANMVKFRSRSRANEKRPWKDLPRLEGTIEKEFTYLVHLGETVLPYRTLQPVLALLPITSRGKMYAGDPKMLSYPGLSNWWHKVERLWNAHRSSDRLSLAQQLDYHSKLTHQFPLPRKRVVYAKAGMHLAAARIEHHRAVIDHKLYWAAVHSDAEGQFLCAILNSATVTARVRPLMSYGKDERDIDKCVWQLAIPSFDPEEPTHVRIAELGRAAEEAIAGLPLPTGTHFSALRREVRRWIQTSDIGQAIEVAVDALLGPT